MSMKKNDLTTVTIEDMGVGGEGIGKVDGYTLFVKDAVIGDVAEVKVMKAKKHYGYARLMKILTIKRQSRACLSGGETMWRLSDTGIEL